MATIKSLLSSYIFWCAWIIIPVIMEIVPAVGSLFLLYRRRKQHRASSKYLAYYPYISIIIPVYNSEATLFGCVESICRSTYPTDRIRVFLVNNGSKDKSCEVYTQCHDAFPDLALQWMDSAQGKSRALNLALYNCTGKYIINIDSDGVLEPHALTNLVTRFEENPDLNCLTGAVLIEPELIKNYKRFFPRLLRELEFMEYAQAFLAGRSYASERDAVYTLSGAFSAFRKSAVLQSELYNTDTICEDTHLTFQMRYLYGERVEVCEDAIFFTDPIENVNKLYTQRQRWQRGSIEVAKMFVSHGFKARRLISDVNVRTLMYDHTFAFPRMIWYLALLCLLFMNNAGKAIVISSAIILALYICVGYFYFLSSLYFLRVEPKVRAYYKSHWWTILLLPLFNLMVFFIRMAGIINSIGTTSAWKTANLTQEWERFRDTVTLDFVRPAKLLRWFRKKLNREPQLREASSVLPVGWYVISGILLLLTAALAITVRWVSSTYGISLNELINTMTGNLQGTSTEVILAVVKGCVLPTVGVIVLYVLFVVFDRKWSRRSGRAGTVFSRHLPSLCSVLLIGSVLYANLQFDVLSYYQTKNSYSSIYEESYIDPNSVAITAGEQQKNLIYIYLESMETTYASVDDGGAQPVNYIPQLTQLAQENTSFSNTEQLGGYHTVTGAGYTMAALFTTTTGVPYAFPNDSTSMTEEETFASGITGLGDILAEQGYTQEFLCGSDAVFGGRELYFQTHGDYEIFDLYTAREQGYIPEDYFVWWGYEDSTLFDIAQDEVTRLAESGEPFNLTMLTVDLHHIAGYICDRCGSEYDTDTANVASCTDELVAEFVAWCQQQPFYEDTVIVVTGDHPRMDTYLVDGLSYYDRTVYNCFINSAVETDNLTNREFTHMDIFPTVLAAMGYEIEGDRLGLGTNLFSDKLTLAEEMGFDLLNTEVSKSSDYYVATFAPELVK
jgi:putative glycosyltransferase (exosortase G-associated)